MKSRGKWTGRGMWFALLAIVGVGAAACQPSTGYAVFRNTSGAPALLVWNFTCPKATNVLSGSFRLVDSSQHLNIVGTMAPEPNSECGTGAAAYEGAFTNTGGPSSVCPGNGAFDMVVGRAQDGKAAVAIELFPIHSNVPCLDLERSVDLGFVNGATSGRTVIFKTVEAITVN